LRFLAGSIQPGLSYFGPRAFGFSVAGLLHPAEGRLQIEDIGSQTVWRLVVKDV
jgi:hypothetical protein